MGSKRQKQHRDSPGETAPKPAARQSLAAQIEPFLDRRSLFLAIAAILVATLRIVATYHVFDHTSDEPAHIAGGMEYLDHGTYTWEPQHPPLARVAVALGPYLIGNRSAGTPHSLALSMFREGAKILYQGNHYDLTLSLARAGVLPFFWIACWVVYLWGVRYFSRAIAATAVIFFSFLPPVLAHAGLATTDMALTAFLGAAFLAGLLWIESPTWRHAAVFGVAGGLMVLSKFSCLLFFPASVALSLIWYLRRARPTLPALAKAARGRMPSLAMAVGIGFLVIWAGYRFSFGHTVVMPFAVPFPELFNGLKQVAAHNAEGHLAYLLGDTSNSGFWTFFLVALAVKTPLGYLALMIAGIVFAFRNRPPFHQLWLPLAFSAGILIVSMFSRINIGIRHILPVYIGFSILAAFAALYLLKLVRNRAAVIASVAFSVWFIGASLFSHPDYLAYFNELAGSQPEKILVDSDLDWGQDQKRLAQRLQELHVDEVYYSPFVVGDIYREGFPKTFRLNREIPSPGWNAVSVTEWKKRLATWPDRVPPLERVGKSILLWHFEVAGLPPPIRQEFHFRDVEEYGRQPAPGN